MVGISRQPRHPLRGEARSDLSHTHLSAPKIEAPSLYLDLPEGHPQKDLSSVRIYLCPRSALEPHHFQERAPGMRIFTSEEEARLCSVSNKPAHENHLVCECPAAAVTKDHEPGGLNDVLSHSLEARSSRSGCHISRADFLWGLRRPSSGRFAGHLWAPWFVTVSL